MAHMPIPPLLCSTPPPIDFGENDEEDSGLPPTLALELEDEEFGDFILGSKIVTGHGNIDVPSLPRTPTPQQEPTPCNFASAPPPLEVMGCQYLPSVSPPPLQTNNNTTKDSQQCDINAQTVEAINLNVLSAQFPTLPTATNSDSDSELSGTERIVATKTNSRATTPIDSCLEKPTSLSAESCESTEKVANQLDADEQESPTGCEVATPENSQMVDSTHQNSTVPAVTVEDVIDDSSDDECRSPKKLTIAPVDESSEDFFAIHVVHDETSHINALPKHETDVVHYTEINKVEEENNLGDKQAVGMEKEIEEEDDFDDFACFETAMPTSVAPETLKETENNIVHDNISTMASAVNEVSATEAKDAVNKSSSVESDTVEVASNTFEANFDDFDDDFQEFSSVNTANSTQTQNVGADSTQKGNEEICGLQAEEQQDDDVDFGDFSGSTFSAFPASTSVSAQAVNALQISTNEPSQTPLLNANTLDKRLQLVLENLFPSTNMTQSDSDEGRTQPIESKREHSLTIDSIDTAKALEFQWINSELRHALIKSLGIDSRNILFGEKWNPSMPRFAANLSGSPLQPMRNQSSGILEPMQLTNKPSEASASASSSKVDAVPAVEFDWHSAGLVNPLDGLSDTVQTGEAKTLQQPQSGELYAASDESLQLQLQSQPQLQSQLQLQQREATSSVGFPTDLDAGDDFANALGFGDTDTATEAPATIAAPATIEISPVIPSDSNTNDYQHGHHLDIGVREAISGNQSSIVGSTSNISELASVEGEAMPSTKPAGDDSTFGLQFNDSQESEVVTTSTYAGPLKETHIYTPPKGDGGTVKTTRAGSSVAKVGPVDFDYKIAAAGIIIDETVVKKEYRDVEYNPGFGLGGISPPENVSEVQTAEVTNIFAALPAVESRETTPPNDFDDEFSDFQSVAAPKYIKSEAIEKGIDKGSKNASPTPSNNSIAERTSATRTPTMADNMILSPAILLPQAIPMHGSKPKIEWGDTAANINPEELARIEELFPQPKSTPTRAMPSPVNTLSISATIAHKEQHSTAALEEDDWSDFVSVSVANNNNQPLPSAKRLNVATKHTPQKKQSMLQKQHTASVGVSSSYNGSNNCNEEEWSDFVSNAPAADVRQMRAVPQFNSAAWQNANFYNNPFSLYQQRPTQNPSNLVTASMPHKFNSPTHNNNVNYNNNNNNIISNQYSHQMSHLQHKHQYQQQQQHQQQQKFSRPQQQQPQYNFQSQPQGISKHSAQPQPYLLKQQQPTAAQMAQFRASNSTQQVHVMQDFSTSVPYRVNVANVPIGSTNTPNSFGPFQVGSAKVAPSVSLVPDLGFVAPAVPTHTALINTLSLPGFGSAGKK